MNKLKLLAAATALIMSTMIYVSAAPQPDEKSEVNADEVEYDMNTGTVNANGNVVLKYSNGTATASSAMYNMNTQAAYLVGNVVVIRDNLKITCDSLNNDGRGYMQADGNVYAEQKIASTTENPAGDVRTFTGEHVDYYPYDRKHVVIPNGGRTEGKDGTFTADHIEGWVDDAYYIGTGNAHIVSPPRNLEAGGDRVDYYANDNGKAVLTGNAWAYQDNNTFRGNRLTVYLADNKKKTASVNNVSPTENTEDNSTSADQPFDDSSAASN
ncbi:MAG: organic solvent tolerance protein OstA [Selenomonadaceae bacterium]|nr:organic solvent tolerance protein OstA [Selenomonadaceae bacterium]